MLHWEWSGIQSFIFYGDGNLAQSWLAQEEEKDISSIHLQQNVMCLYPTAQMFVLLGLVVLLHNPDNYTNKTPYSCQKSIHETVYYIVVVICSSTSMHCNTLSDVIVIPWQFQVTVQLYTNTNLNQKKHKIKQNGKWTPTDMFNGNRALFLRRQTWYGSCIGSHLIVQMYPVELSSWLKTCSSRLSCIGFFPVPWRSVTAEGCILYMVSCSPPTYPLSKK